MTRRQRTSDWGVKNPISVNFRMAFAGVITLSDAEGEALLAIRHAHVPTGGRKAIEHAPREDLNRLAERRPGLEIVALSDGAPEMQSIVDNAVAGHEVVARLADFWHLTEHLGTAISSTGRYANDLLGDWKRAPLDHDDAIDGIEEELRARALEYGTKPVPEGLNDALTFIENRPERLRYASVGAAKLPIGSGTVEATCKTIVETRMKRAGSRWKEEGGQAILALRASLGLCYSRLMYAQCFDRWRRFEVKLFLTEALQYLGGAASAAMLDNHSVVVIAGTGAAATIAPEMEAFSERLGFTFIAHEKGDVNRSARVERPFDFIENNFYPGRDFADLDDLDAQFRVWCDDKNAAFRRGLGFRPRELWAAEKPVLQSLPLYIPEV